MTRKPYSTDLNEEEWQLIEPLLPAPSSIGVELKGFEGSSRKTSTIVYGMVKKFLD